MRVLSVVGARPQFVKLSPVHRALVSAGHEHIIVHTGQHYDAEMSEVFFTEFQIPAPDVNLAVGSGSHGVQTGLMLGPLEQSFRRFGPNVVLVYGDTNSTIAAAIAAVKIDQPVAHLEAGLRSFNRKMPEEHNRVLTDHASDLLLAPSMTAMRNLEIEGLAIRSRLVGDVMVDVCHQTRDIVAIEPPEMPKSWTFDEHYLVATIHRQENTDSVSKLGDIIEYLSSSPYQIRLLAHPRLREKATSARIQLETGSIQVFPPLSYRQLIFAVNASQGVITDSGGLQKEAFLLRVPCITLRQETEWHETVELGWNQLVPACDVPIDSLLNRSKPAALVEPYGSGNAAELVVQAIQEYF